jgi:hypothetical protein
MQLDTKSLPAPLGGWNARDAEANMPVTDALILENWYPSKNSLQIRKGCEQFATGIAEDVKTLMAYASPTAEKFFAATNSGIYDITAGGAIGALSVALTAGRVSHSMVTSLGGAFLQVVNGVDKLKMFDGTAWATIDAVSVPAITGLATTELSHISVFKRRVWYVQKNSMSLWYLPVNTIAGALTEFPVGQLFSRGGKLVATANWTIDGGDGLDDYFVLITSAGELAIYKGTDPSSSTTFALVGVYYVGEPLGDRCFVKYGGDLLVLCQNGLLPLSKALISTTIDRSAALSYKIDNAFTQAASDYSANEGWQTVVFPKESVVFVNVPVAQALRSDQFVMNSVNKAWCRFKNWKAYCWGQFAGDCYFSVGGTVFKAFVGTSDAGRSIVADALTAYSYFGSGRTRSATKHFKLVRPTLKVSGSVFVQIGLSTDFDQTPPDSKLLFDLNATDRWDAVSWDSATWGYSTSTKKEWQTVFTNACFAAAARLRVSANKVTVEWTATDFGYQVGGFI